MYVERRVCIGQESALPMQNADLTAARSSCNASLGGKFSAEAKQTQDCGRRQVNVKRGCALSSDVAWLAWCLFQKFYVSIPILTLPSLELGMVMSNRQRSGRLGLGPRQWSGSYFARNCKPTLGKIL